jgi:hypothetical protein
LSYIFFGSLPLVFVAFFFASWRELGSKSKHPARMAGLLSLIITPIFGFTREVCTWSGVRTGV